MVNVEMFHRVMKHVYENPEEWKQESWGFATSCGTTFCLAGHTAHFAAQDRRRVKLLWNTGAFEATARGNLRLGESLHEVKVGWSRPVHVQEFAAKELGLGEWEASSLFRTFEPEAVWRKVAKLTKGEVTLEKIAAEVEAERARHREDEKKETEQTTSTSNEDDGSVKVVMHDVAVAREKVSA